jgi:hypothetical protein
MTLHVDISNPKEVHSGPDRSPPAAGSLPGSPTLQHQGSLQPHGSHQGTSVGHSTSVHVRAPENLFEAATRGDEEWVSRHVECDVGARARARSALSSGGAVR